HPVPDRPWLGSFSSGRSAPGSQVSPSRSSLRFRTWTPTSHPPNPCIHMFPSGPAPLYPMMQMGSCACLRQVVPENPRQTPPLRGGPGASVIGLSSLSRLPVIGWVLVSILFTEVFLL